MADEFDGLANWPFVHILGIGVIGRFTRFAFILPLCLNEDSWKKHVAGVLHPLRDWLVFSTPRDGRIGSGR